MSDQNDIEALFPWYVTGRLSESDRAKVESYLARNADARAQLDLISEEHEEVVDLAEQIPGPAAGGIDKLMTRLDEEFGPAKPAAPYGIVENDTSSWWQNTIDGLRHAFQMPTVRFGAVAASLVIAVQTAFIVTLMDGPTSKTGTQGPTYQTASGDQKLGPGPVLLITFQPNATVKNIEALLDKHDGVIIKGPISGGIYQVHFKREKASEADTQQLLKSLQGQDKLVSFVAISE